MAHMTHLMDTLVDPAFALQETRYQTAFKSVSDRMDHDYIRSSTVRVNTNALDWCGEKLLTASKDNVMRLYDVESSREECSWPGEWMTLNSKPSDPHVVAAVSWGGRFRVFDTRQPPDSSVYDVDLKKTHAQMRDFLFLVWSPNSTQIAINNRSDQVYLLDVRQGITFVSTKQMQHEVNQMAWSQEADTLWIATGGSPGKIHILPTPSLSTDTGASACVVAHQYTTIALSADPRGEHIASGGGDCLVTLWDPRHLVCVRTFGYPTQPVTTVSFNHDGNLLAWGTGGSASTGGEKNLTIVGAHTGKLHWQDTTPTPVQFVKFHPSRNVLAYTLNTSQMPDERESRRLSQRETAVLRILKIPD